MAITVIIPQLLPRVRPPFFSLFFLLIMMMMRVAADAPPPDMDPPENWLSRQGIDVIPGQSFVATLEGQTNEGLIQQFSSLEMVEGDESITVRERERERKKERKREREREREGGVT